MTMSVFGEKCQRKSSVGQAGSGHRHAAADVQRVPRWIDRLIYYAGQALVVLVLTAIFGGIFGAVAGAVWLALAHG